MILLANDLHIDVTAKGDLYFRLLDHDTPALTRDGHFACGGGLLRSRSGIPLDPPVRVPEGATALGVEVDGRIFATVGGSRLEIGCLCLVKLLPSGERIIGAPGQQGFELLGAANRPAETHTARITVPAAVEVSTSDLVLGEFADVQGGDERLARLSVGAAPLPGGSRLLTRSQVLTRLRSIQMDKVPLDMPETVSVHRSCQEIPPQALMEAAKTALPEPGGLEPVPLGAVARTAPGEYQLRAGAATRSGQIWTVPVSITVTGQSPLVVNVRFQPATRSAAPAAVKPGDQVTVRIEGGSLAVEVGGVARQAGAVGQEINVFLPTTNRQVRAVIVDGRTVKVQQ